MNIFISIKLTRRLGFWIELEPFRKWVVMGHNYPTFDEGRCYSYVCGPISLGFNHPDAKGEKERQEHIDRIKKQIKAREVEIERSNPAE